MRLPECGYCFRVVAGFNALRCYCWSSRLFGQFVLPFWFEFK